ncbi:MAG: hypothetical protein FWJ93_06075 [Micromonosporaceae bacterium]
MNANDARPTARHPDGETSDAGNGPAARTEAVLPPTDPEREAKRRDVDDPADVEVDPRELLDGGPTRAPGAVTTTGGRAGSANVHRRPRRGPDTAPTTTGDATTGGMRSPAGASTSDAIGGADTTRKTRASEPRGS